MQDQHDGPASARACGGQKHRRTGWHDDDWTLAASDEHAVRRLQTRFACQRCRRLRDQNAYGWPPSFRDPRRLPCIRRCTTSRALIGSGPLSATRFPPVARHPTSAIVNSHICPRDSTTVPFDPFDCFGFRARRVNIEMPRNRTRRKRGQSQHSRPAGRCGLIAPFACSRAWPGTGLRKCARRSRGKRQQAHGSHENGASRTTSDQRLTRSTSSRVAPLIDTFMSCCW